LQEPGTGQHCRGRHTSHNYGRNAVPDTLFYMQVDTVANEFYTRNEEAEVYDEEPPKPKETRLRYKDFTLVFHDFKGYESDWENDERIYFGQFGGDDSGGEAVFNDEERYNEDYKETLIVKKDTLHLSEILFDDRINNTLIEIIPVNPDDRFKIYFCYLSKLGEIFDHRNRTNAEIDTFYSSNLSVDEQTRFYKLEDSASFFFRALPHTPDMVEITVVENEIVPVQSNTKKQMDWEEQQYREELERIKKKYKLKDTLVVIPGEYTTVVTLTRDQKLFGYGYESLLFSVEHYSRKKQVETKYIVIYIAYGC
jgi:hypothetical protein